LTATGVAGNPDSYFHRPSISDWLTDLGVTRKGFVPERELLEAIFRTTIATSGRERQRLLRCGRTEIAEAQALREALRFALPPYIVAGLNVLGEGTPPPLPTVH
jgi:LPS sulfotransferase NodH